LKIRIVGTHGRLSLAAFRACPVLELPFSFPIRTASLVFAAPGKFTGTPMIHCVRPALRYVLSDEFRRWNATTFAGGVRDEFRRIRDVSSSVFKRIGILVPRDTSLRCVAAF
jgi:hypothetical protein